MFVKMIWNEGNKRGAGVAWCRLRGYGFDFVSDKRYATVMSEDTANRIVDDGAYYLGMFGADEIKVELF